jgi:hypothetical protein
LIEAGRWETCLQCHDYHGNHRWEPPLRLDKAIALPDIDAYFKHVKHDKAPSPYGDKVIEALDQPRKK